MSRTHCNRMCPSGADCGTFRPGTPSPTRGTGSQGFIHPSTRCISLLLPALLLLPVLLLLPALTAPSSVRAQQGNGDGSALYHTRFVFDIPVVTVSDDFSDITAGAAWDVEAGRLLSVLGRRGIRSGILASDGSFNFQSTGSWLLDSDLNQEPLLARLHFDIGFELIPHPPGDIPDDLFIDDSPPARWSIADLRYHYRAAITLETGVETDQPFDAVFATAGAGLRLLNLSRTGWSGWMPTLLLMYEGVFRISDEPATEAADVTEDTFHRLRFGYRHQLDLATLGLDGFTLSGGMQYTRDFGQPDAFRDAGLHSRFGWAADLSRAIRWEGRDGPRRLDLFVRHTGGQIAPLVTSDRSFTLGLRIPYSP